KYGTGGDYQRAAQAVTAALQGLAGGDIGSALAGASAPYLANIIKRTAGDNDAARIMAQAVLGAVVAQVQGNSAAAGAAGAATGELIAAQLYPNRSRDQLTEAEKQTISALSSLAAGFVGGAIGGDFAGAVTGAQSGRNATENNELGSRLLAEKKYNDFSKQSCDGLPADVCRSNYSNKLMAEGGNVVVGGLAVVGGVGAAVTLGPEILAACVFNPALCTELSLVGAELPFGAATAGGAALGVGGFGSVAAKEMAAAAEAASSAGASLPKNLNISSLDDIVDKAINPAVVRDSLLPYVRGGDTTSLSVATGAVEINGEVNYLLSVSGKSWKGDAPKTVEIGGSQYKVIVADSGVVPSVSNGANGSTNFNHAEQKIMSYLQQFYSGQKVKVSIGVQNTSAAKPGMCSGCSVTSKTFAENNPLFDVRFFQGTSGVNP
ncbi:VENN motif pre-toxin domain-containing protein, partial [Pseudomonas sp. PH1b]|uniref:VENN motif pre-toxin domain-containing protein n=1 Tax=Pseudomonas sp. PH1b TaxID=1397282 RepID=UPI00046A460E